MVKHSGDTAAAEPPTRTAPTTTLYTPLHYRSAAQQHTHLGARLLDGPLLLLGHLGCHAHVGDLVGQVVQVLLGVCSGCSGCGVGGCVQCVGSQVDG